MIMIIIQPMNLNLFATPSSVHITLTTPGFVLLPSTPFTFTFVFAIPITRSLFVPNGCISLHTITNSIRTQTLTTMSTVIIIIIAIIIICGIPTITNVDFEGCSICFFIMFYFFAHHSDKLLGIIDRCSFIMHRLRLWLCRGSKGERNRGILWYIFMCMCMCMCMMGGG